MKDETARQAKVAAAASQSTSKVVNLAFYRLKRSLQAEGFDLITDADGKVTLVIRAHSR
ncbi:MAG: hypothetical protein K1X75_01640 [Leptospirales bacterium]|nr:hypothetical protein [Leptospirales bacterium]